MRERSSNLLEQWVEIQKELGSGTSSTSSDEHISKEYQQKRPKLATCEDVPNTETANERPTV